MYECARFMRVTSNESKEQIQQILEHVTAYAQTRPRGLPPHGEPEPHEPLLILINSISCQNP